ncbi:hypothetical protein Y1Q_0016323 [Alligator mississippiensis]|uniref:Uncharacterized protein n=1 Tax=Alligator mississippiensis TaxID=8496 RepID=A0A151N296_ALLMI|nr:hypothetical protein Y1Q_0016323 [Alligator mississippiensis]
MIPSLGPSGPSPGHSAKVKCFAQSASRWKSLRRCHDAGTACSEDMDLGWKRETQSGRGGTGRAWHAGQAFGGLSKTDEDTGAAGKGAPPEIEVDLRPRGDLAACSCHGKSCSTGS